MVKKPSIVNHKVTADIRKQRTKGKKRYHLSLLIIFRMESKLELRFLKIFKLSSARGTISVHIEMFFPIDYIGLKFSEIVVQTINLKI